MAKSERELLEQRISELHVEHRDLDEIITRLSVAPDVDQLQLSRLKKRKLFVKDMLMKLEDDLIPDLDA